MVVVPIEFAAASECAHAVRGAGGTFGVGVGGSDGGGLHEQGCAELTHRAAQLEEQQHTCEHRVAGCIDSDEHVVVGRAAGILTTFGRAAGGGHAAGGHAAGDNPTETARTHPRRRPSLRARTTTVGSSASLWRATGNLLSEIHFNPRRRSNLWFRENKRVLRGQSAARPATFVSCRRSGYRYQFTTPPIFPTGEPARVPLFTLGAGAPIHNRLVTQ